MHILIATSGVLSPAPVIDFTRRLMGEDGTVTVTTVIEVPRSFLDDLRSDSWHPLQEGETTAWTSADDALVDRYVEERGRRICEPLVKALQAERIAATATYLEGEDPSATISGLEEVHETQRNLEAGDVGAVPAFSDDLSLESRELTVRQLSPEAAPREVEKVKHLEPRAIEARETVKGEAAIECGKIEAATVVGHDHTAPFE